MLVRGIDVCDLQEGLVGRVSSANTSEAFGWRRIQLGGHCHQFSAAYTPDGEDAISGRLRFEFELFLATNIGGNAYQEFFGHERSLPVSRLCAFMNIHEYHRQFDGIMGGIPRFCKQPILDTIYGVMEATADWKLSDSIRLKFT